MSLIELRDFSYKYPIADDFALKNITLSIEKGELVAVIGRNGGGKTSLCNAIRGFVPHFYKGEFFGDIRIEGESLKGDSLGDLAKKIGYIFQNPFNQISCVKETVFEEIAYGLENFGAEPEEIRRRVTEIIDRLGITHLKDKDPFELSGGQQQRVALASILVMDPEILVIDEPTSQLDPCGTEQVFEVIDMVKQEGKTIILVEHKIELIARYADRVCVMDGGRIVMEGATRKILSDPELEEHGVQMPVYAALGHKLVEAGFPLGEIPVTETQAEQCIRGILGGKESV